MQGAHFNKRLVLPRPQFGAPGRAASSRGCHLSGQHLGQPEPANLGFERHPVPQLRTEEAEPGLLRSRVGALARAERPDAP